MNEAEQVETDAVCRCDCAYVGAQMAGTPIRCEQCRGLVDDVAGARMDAIYAESRRELEQWAADNLPLSTTPGQPTQGALMTADRPALAAHAIRWEFDNGGVTATAVCYAAPDADCHLTSVNCECERWGEIQRRGDGTIWHHIVEYGDSIEPVWHEVKPMDDCNVCLFINESGCVEELGAGEFLIGEVPIRPVWIDDGCDWERVS